MNTHISFESEFNGTRLISVATFEIVQEPLPGSQLLEGINADGTPRIGSLMRPAIKSLQKLSIKVLGATECRFTPELLATVERDAFDAMRKSGYPMASA